MRSMEPQTKLDPRFSSEDAKPTPWSAARDQLRDAKSFSQTRWRF